MLRNKKGFTLVELLAVIVILAIILAIAVPTISTLITKQKEAAFAAGVKMLIKGIDYQLLQGSTAYNGVDPADFNTYVNADVNALGGSTDDYQQVTVVSINPVTVNVNGTFEGTFHELCALNATFTSVTVIPCAG